MKPHRLAHVGCDVAVVEEEQNSRHLRHRWPLEDSHFDLNVADDMLCKGRMAVHCFDLGMALEAGAHKVRPVSWVEIVGSCDKSLLEVHYRRPWDAFGLLMARKKGPEGCGRACSSHSCDRGRT
jgi:hypothetical protein